MRTFAAPFEKRVLKKFIEKTDLLYKKQVPRKNTIYREALILLKGIISVSDKLEIYKKLYNEEFDPGSG